MFETLKALYVTFHDNTQSAPFIPASDAIPGVRLCAVLILDTPENLGYASSEITGGCNKAAKLGLDAVVFNDLSTGLDMRSVVARMPYPVALARKDAMENWTLRWNRQLITLE
jgi:hypothetical protein